MEESVEKEERLEVEDEHAPMDNLVVTKIKYPQPSKHEFRVRDR